MPTTNEPLPDYAATVVECGDPQPTIDALTEQLDAQVPPKITTKLLLLIRTHDEERQSENEPPDETSEAAS